MSLPLVATFLNRCAEALSDGAMVAVSHHLVRM